MPQQVLTLSEICDILNRDLKQDTVSLGIDGAQKNSGLCLLRTTKDKLYIEDFFSIELAGKAKGQLHKKLLEYRDLCLDVRKQLPQYPKYHKTVIIEDCYYGQSVWTTKVLAKYSTVSYFMFRKWSNEIPDPIQPVAARKVVGFEQDYGNYHYETYLVKGKKKRKKVWDRKPLQLKDQILEFIEDKFDLIIDDDNLGDALILALVGLIED